MLCSNCLGQMQTRHCVCGCWKTKQRSPMLHSRKQGQKLDGTCIFLFPRTSVSQDRCAKDSRKPVIPHHLCLRRDCCRRTPAPNEQEETGQKPSLHCRPTLCSIGATKLPPRGLGGVQALTLPLRWTGQVSTDHLPPTSGHTFLSCDTANGNVNSGDTIRSQKFAQVDAHIHSNNQPAWGSFTSGMRSKRTCCSSDFLLKNSCTCCGCPIGAPKTFSPCLAAGNSGAPLQTTASRTRTLAAAVMMSMSCGTTPPRFHTCVLPWCTEILA